MKHQHIPHPHFQDQHREVLIIYLPNMDRDEQLISDHARWCVAAEQLVQHHFGVSVRQLPASVRWLNTETGIVITEMTTAVSAHVSPDDFPRVKPKIEKFMWRFGVETSQHTVMYRYGNRDYECQVVPIKHVVAMPTAFLQREAT